MKIAIIGSGVYASATANKLSKYNKNIMMWTEGDPKNIIAPKGVKVSNSYEEVVKKAKVIFILIASKYIEESINEIKKYADKDSLFVIGSKGILEGGKLICECLNEFIPNCNYGVISGPTFAIDVNALEPVGFTFATEKKENFDLLKSIYQNTKLEYFSDPKAISYCGTLKNVYAIGNGIMDGLNFGYSTKCLLVYKAINEMKYIFNKLGLDENAYNTLAGIGDLILTATSPNSRNFTYGIICAKGNQKEKEEFLSKTTVEGYENLKLFHEFFKKKNIEVKLLNAIYEVVINNKKNEELINELLN